MRQKQWFYYYERDESITSALLNKVTKILFNVLHVSTLCSGLVIAMVVSLIFIVLLRFLAGIMVWVMIVLVILVIGYGESLAEEDTGLFD